ncbi:MAG: ABC transporter ATP-binding protein [Lentisphaeria bacterium]|nr:ABC transporter ATP-binding protein [Lentisphaeria bacterium]
MIMNNMLEIKDLCHSYRIGDKTLDIIKNFNFTLEKGKWCCVYGASGSGKTTLLNLIGTLEKPCSGSITINGTDVAALSRRNAAKFRGENIGFIFQSYHLINELNVLENTAFASSFGTLGSAEANRKAKELLEAVGLKERMHHHPSELSGGERQRCAIARSLMNSPQLLLADEPTGNLDEKTGKEILELFTELRRQNPELTILMITHNPEIAKLADQTIHL